MNTNMPENARAIMGDNVPDYGKEAAARLKIDYSGLENTVTEVLAEARTVPERITSEDELAIATKLVKRIRDLNGQVEAFQIKEKEPFLRGGQAVDSFFFSLMDRLKRRLKTGKAGASDILIARVDEYQQRKLAEEQTRRRREAEEAVRKEQEAAAAKAKLAREAEEARLAAERARKPDTIEAKTAEAEVAEQRADQAHVEAQVATIAADDAVAETRAAPADMVRTRVDGGPMATMARKPFADVVDASKLDKAKLWPFIKSEEIERALRAWAKVTGHKESMEGASVGFRDQTVIR